MTKSAWQNRITRYGSEAPDQLAANPRNWRTHPRSQTDALAGVLREVGVVQNVIVNERTGYVVDGHARISLALREGQTSVPVTYVDLSEEEESLILSTLDPLSAMAGADAAQLDALLRDVSSSDPTVQQMLSALAEQHNILGAVEAGAGGDEFDATPESGPTRCQVGDLWLIDGGRHRLIIGDSTDADVVSRLMCGDTPALMVTDPPYGVEYDPAWRADAGVNKSKNRMGTVRNDHRFDWTETYQLSRADVAYVWHDGKRSGDVAQNLIAAGFDIVSQIIWCKDRFALSRGDYHWQHEPAWYAVRSGRSHNWQGARDQATVWHIKREVSGEGEWGHGTQKPLECMARPIQNNTAKSQIVYDPFLGSGTTVIASHRTGRRCYGVEIEPRYGDVILRRCEAEGMSVERADATS